MKLYGVRNKKCLKVSRNDFLSISGHFKDDTLKVKYDIFAGFFALDIPFTC